MRAHSPFMRSARRCMRDSDHAKVVLDLDLNDPPPIEDQVPEEASVPVPSSALQEAAAPGDPQTVNSIVQQQVVLNLLPGNNGDFGAPIDVEAIEDEVEVLPSPSDFPQARNRPRRNHHEMLVLEEESEHNPERAGDTELTLSIYGQNKHARSTAYNKSGNVEFHDNLLDSLNKKRSGDINPHLEAGEVKPREPAEPTLDCPICLDAVVDACSTICGHIFCQKCIKMAVQKLKRCPNCGRKLTKNKFHRVYLPRSG